MKYDLIVIGGGTSGSMAAIAAGRAGLNTLLVEENGYLGGTATGALVSPAMSTKFNDYISDLNEELRLRLKSTGDGYDNWFNPEVLKIVLEQMAIEAKVTLLYYTKLVDVITNNNLIEKVTLHHKGGQTQLEAKMFIDATGDGDLAFLSKIPTEKGNLKGINQPVSLRFTMNNVDIKSFAEFLRELGQIDDLDEKSFHTAQTSDGNWPLKPIFNKAIEDGLLEEEDSRYFQCFSVPGRDNELSFNCPEIFEPIDGTDSWELTKAQIIGKKKILRYINFLRNLPGFEKSFLGQIAPLVGVRETRRVKGKYILTGKDVLSYKKFEDRVISANYPIDIHNISDEEQKLISEVISEIDDKEKFYDIPYSIMLTNEINNLLVVGRCMSSDFIAQSAIRIQNIVKAMGEAAAYLVYLSINEKVYPSEVNNNLVQSLLKEKGFK